MAAFSGFTGNSTGYSTHTLCRLDLVDGFPATGQGIYQRLSTRSHDLPDRFGDVAPYWCTLDLCATTAGEPASARTPNEP
ncbi:MAG: hypothetical protein H6983_02695 [Ectothiorhodospiraceae bacterium]|nr:hypothetical protein [Ectothiorhodospiraceae bacterium]